MRKEIVLAIGGGLTFGVIVAFAVWKLNLGNSINLNFRSTTPKSTSTSAAVAKTDSPPTPKPTDSLSFIKFVHPLPIQTVYTKTLKVTGLTDSEKSWIVLSLPAIDYLTISDDKQTFEADIELEAGINRLIANSITPEGTSSQTESTVLYIPDSSIDTTKLPPAGKESTYVGLITDISGSSIDITSIEESILQISFNEDTTFGNVKSGETTEVAKITSKEIAIGDTIVAIGTKSGSSVLLADKIVIVPAPIKVNIKTVGAKVTATDVGEVSVQLDNKDKTYTVSDSKDLKVSKIKDNLSYKAKFTDLKPEQRILIVTKDFADSAKEVIARRIFILP